MFRMISIMAYVVVLLGIILHYLMFSSGIKMRFACHGLLRKGIFFLGLLSFVVLAVTGFGPLFFGSRLQGYLLMVHMTLVPVFITCVAVLAVLTAGEFSFSRKDAETATSRFRKPAQCGFWLLLALSLPVTLTMTLSMLPLFGTHEQEFLFEAHRWCALVFSLTAVIELYIMTRFAVLKDRGNTNAK